MFRMYTVISEDVTEGFCLFIDAWLYATVELKTHCMIVGPDGQWKISPKTSN